MRGVFYRDWVRSDDLVKTVVSCKETDVCVMAEKDLRGEAVEAIRIYRKEIEDYIRIEPEFKDSFKPVEAKKGAPPIVMAMIEAGKAANVGPMAAVAGAIAEYAGRDLLKFSKEIIVENGGDIFIKNGKNRRFGVFAGESVLTGRLTFEIMAEDTPLGVCTSSGTVGHSLSFGRADAACIIAKDAALADAVATATGNRIKAASDIEKAIDFARAIAGVEGVLIIVGDKIGSWGKIKFV